MVFAGQAEITILATLLQRDIPAKPNSAATILPLSEKGLRIDDSAS